MPKLKPLVAAIVGAGLLQACAVAPVRQALSMQPVQRVSQTTDQSAASWYRLGKFHQERGQLSLAMGAYAQSLALDGGQLDARNASAAIDAQQGRLADARATLERLVDDYPAEAQPHNNLGYVYYLQGDYAAAIAMLNRALALGENVRAYHNLRIAERALREGAPAPMLAAAAPASAAQPATAAAVAAASAIPAPAAPAQSSLELVQLQPNVLELKRRVMAPAMPAMPVPAIAAGLAPAMAAAPGAPASAVQAPAAMPVAAAAAAITSAPGAPAPTAQAPAAMPVPAVAAAAAAAAAINSAPGAPAPAAQTRAAKPAPAVAAALAAMAAAPGRPAAAAQAPAAVTAQAAKSVPLRLEVANGNGMPGLARRYRQVLDRLGIAVDRISNERPFRQQATTIHYRPGYEAQAARLQAALPGQTALQPSAQLAAADLRLILGKDARARIADAEARTGEAAALPLLAALSQQH